MDILGYQIFTTSNKPSFCLSVVLLPGRGPITYNTRKIGVAVQELTLSDYIGRTISVTMYTHYGNSI